MALFYDPFVMMALEGAMASLLGMPADYVVLDAEPARRLKEKSGAERRLASGSMSMKFTITLPAYARLFESDFWLMSSITEMMNEGAPDKDSRGSEGVRRARGIRKETGHSSELSGDGDDEASVRGQGGTYR